MARRKHPRLEPIVVDKHLDADSLRLRRFVNGGITPIASRKGDAVPKSLYEVEDFNVAIDLRTDTPGGASVRLRLTVYHFHRRPWADMCPGDRLWAQRTCSRAIDRGARYPYTQGLLS